MASFATAFKAEIARIARSALRDELQRLQQSASSSRSEIVGLKKRVVELERTVKRLVKQGPATQPVVDAASAGGDAVEGTFRFSPERILALRHRLGLSQADMGQLLGVSGQTIVKWELGHSLPRRRGILALAAIKSLGKKEALARLEAARAAHP